MDALQSKANWLKRLPNKLTLGRIATIPLLLILYPLDFFVLNVICALLFAFAAVTDFFDGYLARKYDSVTPVGALLDPIADKMLIASALIILCYAKAVPPLLAGLLISRDIAVTGMRLVALEQGFTLEVSDFGKAKTAIQSVALFCLLVREPLFDIPMREIGMVALWIALAFSLYSAWAYTRSFLQRAKIDGL